jgi:hypothetical protein
VTRPSRCVPPPPDSSQADSCLTHLRRSAIMALSCPLPRADCTTVTVCAGRAPRLLRHGASRESVIL